MSSTNGCFLLGKGSGDSNAEGETKKPFIPRKAKINGRSWSIEIIDSLDEAVGMCDFSQRKIILVEGSMAQLQDTLFHEMVHAACPSLSEEQVAEVERGVYAVLADNPAIRKWLFQNASKS